MPALSAPRDDAAARPLHGLLLMALVAIAPQWPALRVWPLLWVAPLMVYAVLVFTVPALRRSFVPWRFGRAGWRELGATAALSLVTAVTLVVFYQLAQPSLERQASFLPVRALGGIVAAGVLFSIGNAVLEEVIFRGILLPALEAAAGTWIALLGTSFVFGYAH